MIHGGKRKWGVAAWGSFTLILGIVVAGSGQPGVAAEPREIKVALVQFDSVPEKTTHNLDQMERLARAKQPVGVPAIHKQAIHKNRGSAP
ncbi:MAG: hypothetical protein ABIK89_25505 [Planctomycetota bacterium]